MKGKEATHEFIKSLEDRYGEELVVVEPTLTGTSARPNAVVYSDSDHSTVHLIVEFESSVGVRRAPRIMEHLSHLVDMSGGNYGMLASPDFEYVVKVDGVFESVGGLPPLDGEVPDSRPITNKDEAKFLLALALRDDLPEADERTGIEDIFHHLLLKLEADKQGVEFKQDNLDQLTDSLEEKHPEFVKYADYKLGRYGIRRIFNGIDLAATSRDVVDGFLDSELIGYSEVAQFVTAPELISPVIEFAGVEPDHSVLDPAAGWGLLAGEASRMGADVTAFEGDQGALNCALFLNGFGENEINFKNINYLKSRTPSEVIEDLDAFTNKEQETATPTRYDHIILDTPTGTRVTTDFAPESSGKGRTGVRIEEAFLEQAVNQLVDGGVLVALVPYSILTGERSKPLREYLLGEFKIDSIIEFEQSIYSTSSARAALLRIVNERPSGTQTISWRTISREQREYVEDALNKAIYDINTGNADRIEISVDNPASLAPSQVVSRNETVRELRKKYNDVSSLEEIAEQVLSGVAKPPEGNGKGASESIPFLHPRHVTGEEKPRTVSKESARVVTTESDLLLAIKGDTSIVHVPDSPVVPSSNWGVIRFQSRKTALAYADYFTSEIGLESLEAQQKGRIPYITIAALRELQVPVFSEEEIAERADKSSQSGHSGGGDEDVGV